MVIKNVVGCLQEAAASLEQHNYSLKWFIFGSYLTAPKTANDIDILIVYQSIESAVAVRKSLRAISLCIPLDLLLMTNDEENEFNFIESQGAMQIYPLDFTKPAKPKATN